MAASGFEGLPPGIERALVELALRLGQGAANAVADAFRGILARRRTKRIDRLLRGIDLFSAGIYGDAIALIRDGIGALSEPPAKAALRLILADCYVMTNQYSKAIRTARLSHSVAVTEGLQRIRLGSLLALSAAELERQRFDKALAQLDEAERIARALDDPGLASVLNNRGRILADQGDVVGADRFFQQALEVAEQNADMFGQASMLTNLLASAASLRDAPRAIRLAEAALDLWRQIGEPIGIAAVLGNLAAVHRRQGQIEEAEAEYKEALLLAQGAGNRLYEANQLAGLGLVEFSREDYASAEKYLSASVRIYRSVGNLSGRADQLSNLGSVYTAIQDFKRAEQYHREAIELHTTIGNNYGVAMDLAMLSYAAICQNDFEGALDLFKQARSILQRLGATARTEEANEVIDWLEERLK